MSNNDYQIFALKTDSEENDYWKPRLFESLRNGKARFGWSYAKDGDLLLIKQKLSSGGWQHLSEDEKGCWKAGFLLEVKKGDYLIYINMPVYGKCTIVQVDGPYEWDSWDRDFNHCLKINPGTLKVFDRNDKGVDASLSRRLKLQGKYWKIYLKKEFEGLLSKIEAGSLTGELSTENDRLQSLLEDISPFLKKISERVQHHHPEKKLEELVGLVLNKIPEVKNVERKSGPADLGADVVFEFETGLPFGRLEKVEKCAVQVKSYQGVLGYPKAIQDIENAFASDDSFTCGLIISTALEMSKEFENELDRLHDRTKKPVGVLVGEELSKWLIKYVA
jgi:hypothetical protein